MNEWVSYPDTTLRETYPSMPSRGGSSNKEVSDAVIGMVASQHTAAVHNEAAFRARQRARRLQTRGIQAMREPEDSTPSPVEELPNDPALEEYKAAGWLS